MFDIGWFELVIVGGIAIIVVGPKDLPRMLRTFGQTVGKIRRMANEFQSTVNDALKEAETQADIADMRKSVESVNNLDPLGDIKKSFEPVKKAGDDLAKDINQRIDTGETKPATGAETSSQPETPAAAGQAEPVAAPPAKPVAKKAPAKPKATARKPAAKSASTKAATSGARGASTAKSGAKAGAKAGSTTSSKSATTKAASTAKSPAKPRSTSSKASGAKSAASKSASKPAAENATDAGAKS
ncbi:Sec-independent protein translocase protein TatB [Breoghania sp.]|uniref:Sec-independent protein translocase protein TatB n=1 Tax=Breoghania sp. TaxID=2065378 RepID=UPI0029CA5455|nr:Sec-independent protein translocase protein TatB [Breoghania sp.]